MTRPAEPIFWTTNLPSRTPATVPASGQDAAAAPRRLTLDSIGMKFGADKASGHHDFLGFYERFLAELRDQALSVLELGVNGGESLRMWEEFFPRAKILGIDHRPEALAQAGGRVRVGIVPEADVLGWIDLAMHHGPFDLIVDDGTHFWEHQIAALRALYPFVRPGGYYIPEDIDTSFGDYVPMFSGASRISMANYLRVMSDLVVGGPRANADAVDDAFLKAAAAKTEFVAFHRGTGILRRRPV